MARFLLRLTKVASVLYNGRMNSKSIKKFPIGLSTLEEIVFEGYYYVDKTLFVDKLAHSGKYYFLSRPRRFGKSLLLDTIKQAFLGNQAVFKGLYLEHHWDWEKRYPVIHISFASNQIEEDTNIFKQKIFNLLQDAAADNQVALRGELYSSQFSNLIRDIHQKYQQKVVILIDEYDKPILDAMADISVADKIRDILRGLYGVIKDNDDKIQFAFLTGVTKFAKAGIFSGLNNLNDITFNPNYTTICGYTQTELEDTFAGLFTSEELPEIKAWYNGYTFGGNESVYNPFSILNFFDNNKQFGSYWFASGTPSFLIHLFKQRQFYIPDLENAEMSAGDVDSFDFEEIPLLPLLLQTGYLTIKSTYRRGIVTRYVLSYPNLEVRQSLNDRLAQMNVNETVKNTAYNALNKAFIEHRFENIGQILTSLFAAIPHDWYRNNDIQRYEGFYCATVYSYLVGLGYTAIAEDITSQDRIDMTVILDESIVIMEFKLTTKGDAQSALAQIKQQHYADKYLSLQKPIYLVGISFDPDKRNVRECVFESSEK
jgi:hypothetical protein